MHTPDPHSRLGDDTRAVAPVLGFILIFGFLFVAFAGYQATAVPQQNQAAEFEHLQDVENDLVDVRRGILRASQSDVREFATVQLGLSYPTRLLAINPPQPTGTLQTSDPHNITIESQGDSDDRADVETRFLTYEPGYNELSSTPVQYENSVLYREAENNVFIEDQELVTDGGDTLEITALQNELREQGTGRITLSLFPSREFTADEIPDGDITVTIPTRLDEDYWDDELGDTGIYDGVDTGDNPYPDGVNAIEFDLNTEETELDLNTVGIQSEPEDDESPQKQGVGGVIGDEPEESDEPRDVNGEEPLLLVDGPTPGEESAAVVFEIENIAGEEVTITAFSISTPGKSNAAVRTEEDGVGNIDRDATNNDTENAEVQIRDSNDDLIGHATPDFVNNNANFTTDGNTNAMDREGNSGRGDEATIDDGEIVSVDMGEFNDGNVQLTFGDNSIDSIASVEDTDLTVTLILERGTEVEFYFRVTNVNT